MTTRAREPGEAAGEASRKLVDEESIAGVILRHIDPDGAVAFGEHNMDLVRGGGSAADSRAPKR